MKTKPEKEGSGEGPREGDQHPATIQVSLPADAKLTIDDAATTYRPSGESHFHPTLETGKELFYTLTAEVVPANGKTYTATRPSRSRPAS